MIFIQLEEHCEWFLVHTGDAELFSKIAVNASSTLLDHHWLSFIQVLGWALMTNSQSQDLITILAKVKWWVMLCFFQVEQIIHKCCLGVELLHLHASTSPPTWFRVQQFRISMDLLLCCQVGKVVAREYESNSSRSVSTKTQAFFVYFNHTICLAYFDSQLAGRSSTTRSKPPSSIRRLHTGGELQARKSKCSKLINISFF